MAIETDLSCVVVHVLSNNKTQATFQLDDGASLIVGSGANCGIRLSDPDIAALHCVLRLASGDIQLQNWGAVEGTCVDGELVVEDATVSLHQAIEIGDYKIKFSHPGQALADSAVSAANAPSIVSNASLPSLESETTDNTTLDPPSEPDPQPEAEIEPEPEQASEAAPVQIRPERTKVETKVFPPRSRVPMPLPAPEVDPEMMELLRAEVDCLQAEVAERDRQLIELKEAVTDQNYALEEVNAGETEKLVGRLEDLLDELARSDDRVRVAEELLLAEQEVTREQREEQREIQAWIGEIEDRLVAREEEWRAERDVLNQRVEQAKSDREEMDRRLSSQMESGQHEEIIQELRAELDQVRETLDVAIQRETAAIEKVKELRHRTPDSLTEEQIANAVREERLALAEERASLSRDRAELAKLKSNLESNAPSELEKTSTASDADSRFNEFRQTLRELHEQEKSEAAKTPQRSLGRRIADLWARLDGPTDTD